MPLQIGVLTHRRRLIVLAADPGLLTVRSDNDTSLGPAVIADVLRGARIPCELRRHEPLEAITLASAAKIPLRVMRRDGAKLFAMEGVRALAVPAHCERIGPGYLRLSRRRRLGLWLGLR